MDRRGFMRRSAAAGAAIVLSGLGCSRERPSKAGFKLKYAPHFGMFCYHGGEDLMGQLKFMADEGFAAVEDNWMMRRERAEQREIARQMGRLGMEMGVFIAHAELEKESFVTGGEDMRDKLVGQMREAVEVARRVNAKWFTVVPGLAGTSGNEENQKANVIENLKWCAGVCEKSGVVMVLEPLNRADHPGVFLTKISQGYDICRAVGSGSCKILDGLYHSQVEQGNLIVKMDAAWKEIAYFQVGDSPGRAEPGTGEINFKNIFQHLYEKGYTGIIGMEHGNSILGKEGETAVIEAYQACDSFGG